MDRTYSFPDAGEKHERAPDQSLKERLDTIDSAARIRDEKQSNLFKLIAQPTNSGHQLTDAWLELQIAQRELDHVFETEIDALL